MYLFLNIATHVNDVVTSILLDMQILDSDVELLGARSLDQLLLHGGGYAREWDAVLRPRSGILYMPD